MANSYTGVIKPYMFEWDTDPQEEEESSWYKVIHKVMHQNIITLQNYNILHNQDPPRKLLGLVL